ncbi:MAG TPA: hypothetical protein VII35_06950 [Steroidobacteraceae bacterium]
MHHLIDLVSHGAAFAQIALRELAETENRTEDVVEVVRDAAGQAFDRLHFGRLLQLPLGGCKGLGELVCDGIHNLAPSFEGDAVRSPARTCDVEPLHGMERPIDT